MADQKKSCTTSIIPPRQYTVQLHGSKIVSKMCQAVKKLSEKSKNV